MNDNQIEWKLLQIFAEHEVQADGINEEDIITAIEFDTTGKYLSIGDKAGRLIIFEQMEPQKNNTDSLYEYLTEFQSHNKEYDYLKSVEIFEAINQIEWLRPQGNNQYLITANDKSIKTWKVSDKKFTKAVFLNEKEDDAFFSQVQVTQSRLAPKLLASFPKLHSFNIHSLSICSNGENFLSSDDLKVNIWALDRPSDAFNVVDLKPDDLSDISEVITSSKFHPKSDNIFLYSTSKGIIKIGDLRKSCDCESTAMVLEVKESSTKKNFFTDIINSISDAVFSHDGRYIFSRDFCKFASYMKMRVSLINLISFQDLILII